MLIGKLNTNDINYILENISFSSLTELAIFNKSIESARIKFMHYIGKEFTGVFYDNNKNPQAMILLELNGEDKWLVNLITVSGAWSKIGIILTKFLMQMSSDMIERSGGTIEAYSPFSLHKYFNWFEFMGFVCKEKNNNVYHYVKQVR